MPRSPEYDRRHRDRESEPRWILRASAALAISLVVFVLALRLHEGTSTVADAKSSTHARGAARTVKARAGTINLATATARNPLTTTQMRSFLATRTGSISIAVRDLLTGQEWLYNPNARDQTASIMKVDILETLLRQAQVADAPLGDETADDVQGMIENSNDEDAQELWNQVGGSSGVGAYDASAGLMATNLNTQGYWGESTTSAADQIRLLDELVGPAGLLNGASKRYELGLMENVEADQDWGVSAGVPSGVSVALKNGWVPLTSNTDWEINSIGRIKGDGRDYLIAVLTAHDPSEAYGIDTIQGISPLVWRYVESLTPRNA